MNLKQVKQKAVQEFYPEEGELEEAEELFGRIREHIKEKHGLEAHFAGSASRGTCLKGDKDIDVFVLFPEEASRKELEQRGLEIGKEVFEEIGEEYHVEYAEHPYTKGEIDGREVEIVPCYDVEPGDMRSSVDRTPHHTRWSRKNLDKQQRKDVVALKAFLNARGLYGSSLKTRGFSGYLCEILIHEADSFENLVEEAPEWSSEKTIETRPPAREFESDFVVVDPVDPERNVAAVLSGENYARFIYSCWKLRENPDYSIFKPEESFDEFKLKKEIQNRADINVLKFERPDRVDDIVYPQMRKLRSLLENRLEEHDFHIYSSGVYADEEECRIYFEVESGLPKHRTVQGPRVFHNSRHLEQFTEKYSNVFIEGDRICAKTEREFRESRELLKDFLDAEASELKERGVPNFLAPKVEEARFADPMSGKDKWLKFLFNEFNCE